MNIPKFKHYCDEIQEANRKALAWVDNIPKKNELECMTTVNDGVRHNIVELWNNDFKETHNLPITTLV